MSHDFLIICSSISPEHGPDWSLYRFPIVVDVPENSRQIIFFKSKIFPGDLLYWIRKNLLETQKEITAGSIPTPLKNMSQWEGLSLFIPFLLWNIKNVWNHQPVLYWITRNSRKSHHFQVSFTHGTQRFVAQSSPQLPRRFRVRSSTRGTCTRGSCTASCETFAWDAVEICGFLDYLGFVDFLDWEKYHSWISSNLIFTLW